MKEPFILLKGLKKTFRTNNRLIQVLNGVDLEIQKNDIYGIIGFSGVGKSSLVRCINRLECRDEGQVIIDGVDMMALSKRELNQARQNIGMIFQNFNLFDSMNVFQNVEYPLLHSGVKKDIRNTKVHELLELVGISEKSTDYPSQLSGGQKQRVGIARALANNPKVLLCDEATSALDPQTTLSVLELLKDINEKLGITIIMISHEVEVLKYICNRVAVIEGGQIAEEGLVKKVLEKPMSQTGQIFIDVEEKLRVSWLLKEGAVT